MYEAHKKFGTAKWANLFGPAINVAKNGFPMPKDLHDKLKKDSDLLKLVKGSTTLAKAYLVNNETPVAVGATIKRVDLAIVLEKLAKKGVDEFFKGSIAKEIVEAVKKAGKLLGRTRSVDCSQ